MPFSPDMPFNWNAVLQGVTIGIVASSVLGLFALSRHRVRDTLFRWRLRRDLRLSLSSCGHNLEGITIGVRNHLGKSFVVRHVAMITSDADFALNPTAEVSTSFKGQYPKLTRHQKRALKKGEAIPVGTEIQYRKWRSEPTQAGFVEVIPFTSRRFVLPHELLAGKEGVPTGMRITVEYEAWPQRRKIFQLMTNQRMEQIQKTVALDRQQIASGALNAARQKFGLQPISPGK